MTNVPSQYQSIISWAAQQTGMPEAVVAAQVNDESGFNPNAVSPAGAEGMFQFLPSTYAEYGSGSEFNPSDEVKAYVAYMKALLSWSGGNVQKALAAYNAGQGNWQAGLGYANSILSAAGTGDVTVQGGSTATTAAAGGVVSDIGDALSAAGTLVKDTAQVLNWIFDLFRPGQMFRLGALVVSVGSGYMTVKLYTSSNADSRLPMIFLLGSVTVGSAYMALRPWPVSASGKPIRTAPYVVDIFQGKAPASTALPDDTGDIEAGLYALLGIWIVSQTAKAASGASGIFGGILGKLWQWAKGLGKAAEDVPIEDVPALAYTTPAESTTGSVQLV